MVEHTHKVISAPTISYVLPRPIIRELKDDKTARELIALARQQIDAGMQTGLTHALYSASLSVPNSDFVRDKLIAAVNKAIYPYMNVQDWIAGATFHRVQIEINLKHILTRICDDMLHYRGLVY